MDNSITISTSRYKQLLRAETTLEIVTRMIKEDHPYDYKKYCIVLGIEEEQKAGEDDGKS